ncbi:MAG: histidinol-phosphate transaminase [Clostridiales bacterium]|nr:histidinol-phosphate transaminase [Clostridiales bacterium]
MAYESELALRLVPYVAGEQPKNVKLIKLNTNENPYPPSPKVAEAMAAVAADSLRLYPDMDASALCAAIAKVNGVAADCVFCGNGSDEVLAFAFAAFFAGKTLAAPDVTYSFYPVYANLFGVDYRTVPLKADFTVDVDGLMQGGPIALANPNAPTGLMLEMSEVERLAMHAKANDAVLLVDEAYAAFAPGTAIGLLERYDNVLITRTFSKSHALAGMRIGYAIGSPRLIAALKRVRDSFNSYPLDRLAQAAGEAAILDTDYTAKTVQLVCEARDACYEALKAAGIPVLKSSTNFLFVQADPEDAAQVQQLLREEGVLVRHFKAERLKAWLRVTVGTMEDMKTVTGLLLKLCRRA